MTAAKPGSLSEKVLRYVQFIKDMAPRAKEPGYSLAVWDPLGEMVDRKNFVRVGRFKEVMNWQQCVELMHQWAGVAELDSIVRRITEVGNRVFFELEEHSTLNGEYSEFYTVSVITFNDAGLISRFEFYQQ